MRQTIDQLMELYGTTLILDPEGKARQVRGFFQPVTSKSWQNMTRTFQGLGEIPRGQYLYLGPAEPALERGGMLEAAGEKYIARKAETILFRDTALYIWALCVKKGGEDPWNS